MCPPVVEMAVLIHNLQLPRRIGWTLWRAAAVPICLGAIALAQTAKVEQVRLISGESTSLEIVANAPVNAQAQVLSNPERLAIDVPNAEIGSHLQRLRVHTGVIKDIRVGLFSTNPPITRIVVDWNTPTSYRIVPAGKTVIVKLDDAKPTNDNDSASPANRPLVAVNAPGSRVEKIRLVNNEGVKIEIAANGGVAPQTQVLTDPDRLVIDIPNAKPGATLHGLVVGRWGVKSVRTGLLSNYPPVTRIVVDLDAPQPYQISSSANVIVVQVGERKRVPPEAARGVQVAALLKNPTSLPVLGPSRISTLQQVPAKAPVWDVPKVSVSYGGGLLGIRADRATLAEVLNELRRKTGADVSIPAGSEKDRIVVNLGPAGPNEVLRALLNGTEFNFILMGSASDPNQLRSVVLMPRERSVAVPSDAEESTNNDRHPSTATLSGAGSFQHKDKVGAEFSPSPAAQTTSVRASQPRSPQPAGSEPSSQSPAPQPSTPQQPSALPSDHDLSTPRPVGADQPPPPPQ
jgi:AMIN domain